jgi:hypothetical protein
VHAIGDLANRKVLTAIASAQQSMPPGVALAMPNRIEHVQLIHPADLPMFAEHNIIASMQPIHAMSDMHMADALWGTRCRSAYALRMVQEAGAVLALGSDAPIETLNPWHGIHAAVTRQRIDGTPPGGWYPDHALSLTDALNGYCVGPAITSSEAHEKGRLTPGMLADLAVLARDPFAIPAADLHAMQVDMTLVEGAVVWEQ